MKDSDYRDGGKQYSVVVITNHLKIMDVDCIFTFQKSPP